MLHCLRFPGRLWLWKDSVDGQKMQVRERRDGMQQGATVMGDEAETNCPGMYPDHQLSGDLADFDRGSFWSTWTSKLLLWDNWLSFLHRGTMFLNVCYIFKCMYLCLQFVHFSFVLENVLSSYIVDFALCRTIRLCSYPQLTKAFQPLFSHCLHYLIYKHRPVQNSFNRRANIHRHPLKGQRHDSKWMLMLFLTVNSFCLSSTADVKWLLVFLPCTK